MYVILVTQYGRNVYFVASISIDGNFEVVTELTANTYDSKLFDEDSIDNAVKLARQELTAFNDYKVRKVKL